MSFWPQLGYHHCAAVFQSIHYDKLVKHVSISVMLYIKRTLPLHVCTMCTINTDNFGESREQSNLLVASRGNQKIVSKCTVFTYSFRLRYTTVKRVGQFVDEELATNNNEEIKLAKHDGFPDLYYVLVDKTSKSTEVYCISSPGACDCLIAPLLLNEIFHFFSNSSKAREKSSNVS